MKELKKSIRDLSLRKATSSIGKILESIIKRIEVIEQRIEDFELYEDKIQQENDMKIAMLEKAISDDKKRG